MAKEIVVVCDACQDRAPAETTQAVTIGSMGPGTLDLCESHTKELVEPLLQLLTEHGADDEGKPLRRRLSHPAAVTNNTTYRRRTREAPPGGFLCFVCKATFDTFSPFQGHFPLEHGARMGEIVGNVCPVDGEPIGSPASAGHHNALHEVNYTAGLFNVALAQGDPLGLVKERIKLVEEHRLDPDYWKLSKETQS